MRAYAKQRSRYCGTWSGERELSSHAEVLIETKNGVR